MNHIAAIHAIKARLKLSEGDYRALLTELTGKDSCKAMHATQLAKVRSHMDNLSVCMGVAAAKPEKRRLSAHSRLLYSLWQQCADSGVIGNRSFKALQSFVKAQTRLDHIEFLTKPQVSMVKKALTVMRDRGTKV
jgi:phage gp16-like protein